MSALSPLEVWVLIIVSGMLTFLIRYAFIAAEGLYRAPSWLVHLLPFVPIAVLSALVVPELVLRSGELAVALDNPRLLAGTVAIAVAARYRNTLLTIACGLIALYFFKFLT